MHHLIYILLLEWNKNNHHKNKNSTKFINLI